MSFIGPLVNFLKSHGSPILVNVYPYFAYTSNQQSIDINYALVTSPGTLVIDSNNVLKWQNLFNVLVNSGYAAVGKAGAPNAEILVTKSGWPSDCEDTATVDNEGTYYRNVIMEEGYPLKEKESVTYLFPTFDEDQILGQPVGQHSGQIKVSANQPHWD